MAQIGIKYKLVELLPILGEDMSLMARHGIRYECVFLTMNGREYKYDFGDVVKDWYDAMKQFTKGESTNEILTPHESLYEFINNQTRYKIAYLKSLVIDRGEISGIVKSIPVLDYNTVDYHGEYIFVVPSENEITWEDLRIKYN